MDTFAGNDIVLAGDAARLVEPISSSGVSIALYSAKYSSSESSISSSTMVSASGAQAPGEKAQTWYEFVRIYYKLLPLLRKFIEPKKHP
jgi:flavin-dependent dehydrogenase